MRVAIVSRIFEPEPSAASFRLAALARAFAELGDDVTVLTVRPPAALAEFSDADRPYKVRRAPVLRDRSGYVRGYLQYLSFDVPLFFRILFGRRRDLIVSEPPPTTGFFVRLAAMLRRTPYAYYAADIWSDAASQTGAPRWVVRVVRAVELFAMRGAAVVFSVSEGVTARLSELGITHAVSTIGNGIDADSFTSVLESAPDGPAAAQAPHNSDTDQRKRAVGPEFVYAGTASEWHGASVFVEAMPEVLSSIPDARMRFIGGGSEREQLEDLARSLDVSDAVDFEPVMSAEQLAPVLRACTAAVASVKPGAGYDFAFPTKLYSAAVCGAPLIYAGVGPAIDFVRNDVDGEALGTAVAIDAGQVATAMIERARSPWNAERRGRVSDWARERVSLRNVAQRAVTASLAVLDAGAAVKDSNGGASA